MIMGKAKKLSIIIPCYNEESTIKDLVSEVMAVELGSTKKEIIIIDDCSKDNTRRIIKQIASRKSSIQLIFQEHNQGKGAALKLGILASTGDVLIIQDADQEYDPEDYRRLLRPIERNKADVVYGSRFIGGEARRLIYSKNRLANKFLTTLSNIFSGLTLTDMETCYKMMRGDLIRSIALDLKAKRFGFEPEVTARISKSKVAVCEVGISYYGRSKEEGKKIGLRDGLRAVWEIIYFNLTSHKSLSKENRLDAIKRIAVVSDTIYPYFKGGKEKRIYEVTTRLAKAGYEVHVYTMKWWEGPKIVEENGVYLHGIGKLHKVYVEDGRRSILAGVLFGFACLKLINEPFDVIDADHMPYLPLFAVWLVCKTRHKKMYATWHEVWSKEYWSEYLGVLGIIAYFIERISTLLPDRIIVDSDLTLKRLALRHPKRNGQLLAAYNGVNLNQIASVRPKKKKTDVVYAGRLIKHKNIPLLISAIKKLSETFEDINCVIIGDGPEKKRLEQQVKRLQLSNNVTFTGFLPRHEEVYAYMKSSKAFILPSAREGFGLVVLEANACGLPVLTLDHPDNAAKDLIKEGVNGFVFNNSKELAKHINYIMKSGKEDALHYLKSVEQYDWQHTVDYVLDAYTQ
jgi:glycosyltransferase involved in cell wall biosynthesis